MGQSDHANSLSGFRVPGRHSSARGVCNGVGRGAQETTSRLEAEVSRRVADVMVPAWLLQTSTPLLTSFFHHYRDIHPADTDALLRRLNTHRKGIPLLNTLNITRSLVDKFLRPYITRMSRAIRPHFRALLSATQANGSPLPRANHSFSTMAMARLAVARLPISS